MSFINPKLLISQYYDSLIRELDIFIEEQHAACSSDYFLEKPDNTDSNNDSNRDEKVDENENIWDEVDIESCDDLWGNEQNQVKPTRQNIAFADPYTNDCINCSINSSFDEWPSKPTRVHEYLDKVRENLISKVNEAQKEAFQRFESIKSSFKIEKSLGEMERIEQLNEKSLVNMSIFSVVLDPKTNEEEISTASANSSFKMLIVSDFYLNKNILDALNLIIKSYSSYDNHNIVGSSNLPEEIKQNFKVSLLAALIHNYIEYIFENQKWLHKIVYISKQALFSMKTIRYAELGINRREINLENDETTLKAFNFSNLKSFEFLSVCDCQLHNLSGLTSLRYLYLYDFTLFNKSFSNLHNLRTLRILDCDLENITSEAFVNLPNLKHLEIRNPRNIMPDLNYSSLVSLKWLIVYDIKSLQFLFNLNSDLLVLEIHLSPTQTNLNDYQHLRSLSHSNLTALNLHGNNFEGHCFDFDLLIGLSNLKFLNLQDCKIEKIDIKSEFPKLQSLRIGDNRIESLDLEKLVNLKSLEMFDNCFDLSACSFLKLKFLEKLDISGNEIGKIEKHTFQGLSNLVDLNLADNQIEHLDSEIFIHVPKLAKLNLSQNNIKIEKSIWENLRNLRELDFSENMPQMLVTGVFSSLNQLEKLNLSVNEIMEINQSIFDGLECLKVLHLNDNQLDDQVPLTTFTDMKKLKQVHLGGNFISEGFCLQLAKFYDYRITFTFDYIVI